MIAIVSGAYFFYSMNYNSTVPDADIVLTLLTNCSKGEAIVIVVSDKLYMCLN